MDTPHWPLQKLLAVVYLAVWRAHCIAVLAIRRGSSGYHQSTCSGSAATASASGSGSSSCSCSACGGIQRKRSTSTPTSPTGPEWHLRSTLSNGVSCCLSFVSSCLGSSCNASVSMVPSFTSGSDSGSGPGPSLESGSICAGTKSTNIGQFRGEMPPSPEPIAALISRPSLLAQLCGVVSTIIISSPARNPSPIMTWFSDL